MNVSISRNGSEIGEWPEDQVRTLYKNGKLLPTDYYWKEGMTEWAELSKMIKPPLPAGKTQPIIIDTAMIAPPVATAFPFKYKDLKGSGATKDDPIEIIALNTVSSAWNQNDVLDTIFGKAGYDPTKNRRLYSESPRGLKGNGDLCETIVTLNDGTVKSVWFDLYMVARITSQKKNEVTPKTKGSKHQSHSFEVEHMQPFVTTGNCYRFFIFGLSLALVGVALGELLHSFNTLSQICQSFAGFAGLTCIICGIRFLLRLYGWIGGILICGVIFLLLASIPLLSLFTLLIPFCIAARKFKRALRENGYKLDWYGRVVGEEA